MDERKKPAKSGASRDARQARLADALRANLRRRKAQARERNESAGSASEAAANCVDGKPGTDDS